ncbi:DUF7660 family protein [Streptomyces mirabilis]
MRRSHAEDGRPWENTDLPSFLDALAAWMDDAHGWYRNTGRELPPGRSARVWHATHQPVTAAGPQ